jgi:hypothetical protein
VRNILLALLSSLAKVEAQKIGERTKAGMARAKANGIKIGRPKLGVELRQQIARRAAKGETRFGIRVKPDTIRRQPLEVYVIIWVMPSRLKRSNAQNKTQSNFRLAASFEHCTGLVVQRSRRASALFYDVDFLWHFLLSSLLARIFSCRMVVYAERFRDRVGCRPRRCLRLCAGGGSLRSRARRLDKCNALQIFANVRRILLLPPPHLSIVGSPRLSVPSTPSRLLWSCLSTNGRRSTL